MRLKLLTILLAILAIAPATVIAQESESLYNGWGIGFQVGAGMMAPTGSLSDDLKGCVMFTGGLMGEYRNLRLKADVAYGQPSFKNENPYAVRDDSGRNLQLNGTASTTLLGGGLQVGYTVVRRGRVAVTPCVGMSASRLSWEINHLKWEKDDEGEERPTIDNVTGAHENTIGWMASVDFDISLHGKITDSPFGDGQAHYGSLLRVTPFVSHAKFSNFSPGVKGVCIGISVSYAGLMRLL